MGYHQRPVTLVADSGGSAAGTIGVPPGRYAGTYYTLTSAGAPTINVENMKRAIFTKAGAANSDGVQELAPTAEKLVAGEVEVSISGATPDGTAVVVCFFHETG